GLQFFVHNNHCRPQGKSMKRVAAPFLIAAGCVATLPAGAAETAGSTDEVLSPVIVSATRLRSVADLDVPASVTTISVDADSNGRMSDVTDLLAGVPGVTALDRQNYAQDTQLS